MNEKSIMIKMVTNSWSIGSLRINKFLNEISDKEMELTIVPNGNQVKWIIGHLAASNNTALETLGIAKVINPILVDYYSKKQLPGHSPLSNDEIKDYWHKTLSLLNSGLEHFTAVDWFERHNSISPEDFTKEPHRNKLNVILNRSVHLSHHFGQLSILVK